jgi:hypothetical protein
LSVTMWFASNGESVALRDRLSRYNRLSEAGRLCITMVQAKPGQVSKGRIARRIRAFGQGIAIPLPTSPGLGTGERGDGLRYKTDYRSTTGWPKPTACVQTMVQAKPGQDSKGRIALRRVWDAAHPRLREGDCDPPPDLPRVWNEEPRSAPP